MADKLIDNRQIRVFISSTFQDMQDERDELMKKTFPLLRQKASERDVMLTELDLRWGITPEESQSGKVVEICLREIENSLPFFIGIVGNRYGWIPRKEDIGNEVFERFRNVGKYVERRLSVTEIEMQYGVLDRPEDMHAYFFIKKDGASDVDEPEKLFELKNAILHNSRYPVSYYSDVNDLSVQVETAFSHLLDELFPEGNLTELEKERLSQRSFMNQLSATYIKDERYFKVLDDFVSDKDTQFLVVSGESGLGKSSLIANWLKESALRQDKYCVAYHFVGNGGSVGNHLDILKCLVNEIGEQYGIARQPGSSDEKELDRLFGVVALSGKPLVIVLDAINQIQDIEDAKLLNWIPFPPQNVKILYSTLLDDKTMEVFKNRNYPLFILSPLDRNRRISLVNGYLKSFAKKLDQRQVERIVDDPQSSNTLVLKTTLNELINFGVFEKLDDRISYYLASTSIKDFYQRVLRRYEDDFGTSFIRHILSLIAVSRVGLAEHEILEITGIKPLDWSRFFCAFSSHLNVKSSLISYSHSYIREAVEDKYITPDPLFEKKCREEIVSHFCSDSSPRAMLEMPFQLNLLNDNEQLFKYLDNVDVLKFWMKYNGVEFAQYWRKLKEDKSSGHDVDVYMHYLPDGESRVEYYETMLDLCSILSDVDKSKRYSIELKEYIENQDLSVEPKVYRMIGANLKQPYRLNFAKKALKMCLDLYGEKHPETIDSYGALGSAYYDLNVAHNSKEYERLAFESWEKQSRLSAEFFGEANAALASSYRDMALTCSDLNKGLQYGLKSIAISKAVFGEHHPQVGWSYNHTGCVYRNLDQHEKALECFQKSYDCWYPAYGENHHLVAASVNNQGHELISLGKLEEGLTYHFRALKIRKAVYGEAHDYANSLSSVGSCYYKMGQYEKALEYHSKAFEIFDREKTRPYYTALSHANLCKTLMALGRYSEAVPHGEEAVKMTIEQVGENDALTISRKELLAKAYEGLNKAKG